MTRIAGAPAVATAFVAAGPVPVGAAAAALLAVTAVAAVARATNVDRCASPRSRSSLARPT
jgi:hypothetical protein